jgi:hypothetical protein
MALSGHQCLDRECPHSGVKRTWVSSLVAVRRGSTALIRVHKVRDMHAKDGENELALSIVERALANSGDVTGLSWEAELHRQSAQILLALEPSKVREAESHLKKSLEVARGQSVKSLELRAATSLGELWRTQGRPDEARALLENLPLVS